MLQLSTVCCEMVPGGASFARIFWIASGPLTIGILGFLKSKVALGKNMLDMAAKFKVSRAIE